MPVESERELVDLVKSGCRLYYDVVNDRFRAYDPRTRKLIRVSRSINKTARYLYVQQEFKRGSRGRRAKASESGVEVSELVEILGKEYGEILKTITQHTRWFTRVLVEIGWRTLIMTLLHFKVDSRELAEKLREFEEPEKFADFILSRLHAVLEANREGAEATLSRDERLKRCEHQLRVEKAVNEELRSQLGELTRHLQVAYIVFDKHGLTLEYVERVAQLKEAIEPLINMLFQPLERRTQQKQ